MGDVTIRGPASQHSPPGSSGRQPSSPCSRRHARVLPAPGSPHRTTTQQRARPCCSRVPCCARVPCCSRGVQGPVAALAEAWPGDTDDFLAVMVGFWRVGMERRAGIVAVPLTGCPGNGGLVHGTAAFEFCPTLVRSTSFTPCQVDQTGMALNTS